MSLSESVFPAVPIAIDPVFVGSNTVSLRGAIRRSRPVSLDATEFRLCFVRRLNGITTEDIQQLKSSLGTKAPKTVNNVLTTLNTLLKVAVEWGVIEEMPCHIRLIKAPRPAMAFHDFAEYERLVEAAKVIDSNTVVIVLLGGEAGLRCGEMMASEWPDVDLDQGQIRVRLSEWKGQVTEPKGGRIRYVPLTARLAAALREHRHLKGRRVLVDRDGRSFTQKMVQDRVRWAARRAGLDDDGVHIAQTTRAGLAVRCRRDRGEQSLLRITCDCG